MYKPYCHNWMHFVGKTVGDDLTLTLTLSLTLNLTLTLFLTLNLTLNVTVTGLGRLPRFCQFCCHFRRISAVKLAIFCTTCDVTAQRTCSSMAEKFTAHRMTSLYNNSPGDHRSVIRRLSRCRDNAWIFYDNPAYQPKHTDDSSSRGK